MAFERRAAARWSARMLLLLLAGAGRLSSAQVQRWAVLSGQSLADAATAWGLQNSDATFALPAASIVSLRDATFRLANNSQARGGKAYANGTFTIQGSGGPLNISARDTVPSSVFDAAMRVGLTPTGLRQSYITISDLAFINFCWAHLNLLGLPISTPLLLRIFSQSPAVVSLHQVRALMYFPHSTIAFTMYTMMTYQSPPSWTTGALDLVVAWLCYCITERDAVTVGPAWSRCRPRSVRGVQPRGWRAGHRVLPHHHTLDGALRDEHAIGAAADHGRRRHRAREWRRS